MRNFLALSLVLGSGVLLFYSGLQVYECFNPREDVLSSTVRLVRVEGQFCPLYFPADQ